MRKTSNYELIVVEGSDKVNLLTQMNPNTEKIDEVMKSNENSGVQIATELFSGTVHAITRTVKSASMFKFTAVSNYTLGDTFTVDGVQVTALLTSGEALETGAYIIGSEVLCSLKGTLLTVYSQKASGKVKLAENSEKLGGELPNYYAKQSELDNIENVINDMPKIRCGRIRAGFNTTQYLKANVIFDKDMPSYDYSVAIGVDSNTLNYTAIYYENRNTHGFTITIYKEDGNFTSADGINLSWIAVM